MPSSSGGSSLALPFTLVFGGFVMLYMGAKNVTFRGVLTDDPTDKISKPYGSTDDSPGGFAGTGINPDTGGPPGVEGPAGLNGPIVGDHSTAGWNTGITTQQQIQKALGIKPNKRRPKKTSGKVRLFAHPNRPGTGRLGQEQIRATDR